MFSFPCKFRKINLFDNKKFLESFQEFPFEVNPERCAALRSFVTCSRGLGLKFVLDKEDLGGPRVSQDRRVLIGIPMLERWWAKIQAYVVMWDLIAWKKHGIYSAMPAICGEMITYGMSLSAIEWAIEAEEWSGGSFNQRRAPPSWLPQPSEGAPPGVPGYAETETFRCAMAFVLHHEIAHVALGHRPIAKSESNASELSLFQEREADAAAARAMLTPNLPIDDDRFRKRVLGIAAILAAEMTVSIHRWGVSRTHPNRWKRPFEVLDPLGIPSDHPAWWIIVVALSLHLSTSPNSKKPSGAAWRAPQADALGRLISYNAPRDAVKDLSEQIDVWHSSQ